MGRKERRGDLETARDGENTPFSPFPRLLVSVSLLSLLIPPLGLPLFHERVRTFLRVFGLHQLMQI